MTDFFLISSAEGVIAFFINSLKTFSLLFDNGKYLETFFPLNSF